MGGVGRCQEVLRVCSNFCIVFFVCAFVSTDVSIAGKKAKWLMVHYYCLVCARVAQWIQNIYAVYRCSPYIKKRNFEYMQIKNLYLYALYRDTRTVYDRRVINSKELTFVMCHTKRTFILFLRARASCIHIYTNIID